MAQPSPIKHVVIIVKENHAFDNYFGRFPGANGDAKLPHAPDPPATDHPHDHATWLRRAKVAVRQQYFETDIPAYWAYSRQFVLCDNYFTDVAGPSAPNHLMLVAAASPIINNPHFRDPANLKPPFDLPSLPEELRAAGLTWRNYGGFVFDDITRLRNNPWTVTSQQFAMDAASGVLPSVSWVYAPSGLSEHPTDSVKQGMAWTVSQVDAIVKGGLWPSVAVFITWDDWGGWADHVVPPNVEQWTDGTPFRYGSRVPCLVLSPFAKRGFISKVLHSHVSLVRFCEMVFGLPSLNLRDAGADGMQDCFDFGQQPGASPTAAAGGPKLPRPPKNAQKASRVWPI
jgi:phospholipase C